jgi:putative nucleotidyltransferase with HDIG domain
MTTSSTTLLREIESLPTFPSAAVRLMGLVHDASASAADIEQVLRTDPSLTANVLRVANSTFYGGMDRVASVRQAIARLGTREVLSITSSTALGRILPDELPGYHVSSEVFWRHCLAVAIFSENIGAYVGIGVDGAAFTAGLLHDLGKLALGALLTQTGDEVVRRQLDPGAATFVNVERTLLGTDHAEAGYTLATHWNLPEEIAVAARYHHRPEEAPSGKSRDLCSVVHVGNAMAHLFGYTSDQGELSRTLDPNVLVSLELNQEILEEIACDSLEPIRDMGGAMTF